MIFTQEQIQEIHSRLGRLGIKDTDLPPAHEIDGSETIAIVQDSANKKMPLSSILNGTGVNYDEQPTKGSHNLVDSGHLYNAFEDVYDAIDSETSSAIGSKSVRFDEAQNLTEEEKATARNNIGIDNLITVDNALSDTSENPVQNKVVKAAIDNIQGGADKEYNPAEFSGLGKVYLKKNIVEVGDVEMNILTQSAFYKEGTQTPNTNTVFVVQYDFDLNGETIALPENSTLEFDGGSIVNGKITGEANMVNMPESMYDDTDLNDLFIKNERHLCRGDISLLFDDKNNTTNKVMLRSMPGGAMSAHYYYVKGMTHLRFRIASSVLCKPNVSYLFYDAEFKIVGISHWVDETVDPVRDSDWASPWFPNSYYVPCPVPEEAVYCTFKLSSKDIPYMTRSTLDFSNIVGKMSFNFLDNTRIEIDASHVEYPETLNISMVSGFGNIVVRNSGTEDESYRLAFSGHVGENEQGNPEENGSYMIPYEILKEYDTIEIQPDYGTLHNGVGKPTGQLDFLKKTPIENEEEVEYSDWYPKRYSFYNSSITSQTFVIPPDCRCIFIYRAYSWQGTIYNCAPSWIKLHKMSYYGAPQGFGNNKNNTVVESDKDINNMEMKFMHWNIGADNIGGMLNSQDVTEELINKRRSAFGTFFGKLTDYNIMFNEYNRWLNPNRYNFNTRINYTDLNSTRYTQVDFNTRFGSCAIANMIRNGLLSWKIGIFDCLKGLTSSNNRLSYSYNYVIYEYALSTNHIYILHTHLPTGLREQDFYNIYKEMQRVTASYPNVFICGDFNDIGHYSYGNEWPGYTPDGDRYYNIRNAFDLNTWHIANMDFDETPTLDISKSRGDENHAIYDILDFCIYRTSQWVEMTDFRVRKDCVVPGSTAEGEGVDPETGFGNSVYINHRLSDHWPIEFTIRIKGDYNVMPSNEGNIRYNPANKKLEWHNGDTWMNHASDTKYLLVENFADNAAEIVWEHETDTAVAGVDYYELEDGEYVKVEVTVGETDISDLWVKKIDLSKIFDCGAYSIPGQGYIDHHIKNFPFTDLSSVGSPSALLYVLPFGDPSYNKAMRMQMLFYNQGNSAIAHRLSTSGNGRNYHSGWHVVSSIDQSTSVVGPTANRPEHLHSANKGFVYFDTSLEKSIIWDGADWKDVTGASV